MKVKTVQILWHAKQPIFTCDFEPHGNRLATGGGDQSVRMWRINRKHDETAQIEFVSTLKRHSAPVNCVRWAPNGETLATGGDDGTILLWQQNKELVETDEDLSEETWKICGSLRGSTSEIYDLAWSPDGMFVMTANLDNTCKIFSVSEQRCIHALTDHTHFVQGVAWDPKSSFISSQSSDRSVCVYSYSVPKPGSIIVRKLAKHAYIPEEFVKDSESSDAPPSNKKGFKMYHDEALLSFFRRPRFSPDGSLFVTPTGIISEDKEKENINHCAYLYTRSSLLKNPVAVMSNFKKPCIAVRWNPIRYKLTMSEPLIKLPYRYVYAIITQDSVYLYDTQQSTPLAYISQLHYSTFTDLAWSNDGLCLVVTSTDGFSSLVIFEQGELGEIYQEDGTEIVLKNSAENNFEFSIGMDVEWEPTGISIAPIGEPAQELSSGNNAIIESGDSSLASNPQKKRRIAPTFIR